MIHYISSRSIDVFRDPLALSGHTGRGIVLNNNYLTVQHSVWQNAVAYETFLFQQELIYVSITGTGHISNQITKVYYPSNAAAVYVVDYNGQKILVYPTALTLAGRESENISTESLMVYPNTVGHNETIHFSLKKASGNYSAKF